jgi:hypothetical protein
MKRVNQIILLLVFVSFFIQVNGQVVNETAKRKVSIGIGLFTDVLMKFPSNVKPRTINQGFNVFGTYNIPFGKSNFGFAIGLGLTAHNIYGNFQVNRIADSTKLIKIPDGINYKRSKMTLAYLEVPIEFRFKSNNKISVGIGFKGGFLIGSSTKYVGPGGITTLTGDTIHSSGKIRIKVWGLKDLESITYGPTFRIGYKWFNVNASYMLSSIFNKSRGPEIVPLSIGFILMPF